MLCSSLGKNIFEDLSASRPRPRPRTWASRPRPRTWKCALKAKVFEDFTSAVEYFFWIGWIQTPLITIKLYELVHGAWPNKLIRTIYKRTNYLLLFHLTSPRVEQYEHNTNFFSAKTIFLLKSMRGHFVLHFILLTILELGFELEVSASLRVCRM